MRISKSYRGSEHVGWKKTVGGKSWFLGYGTSPGDEQRAIKLATALEAKWQLAKLRGATELSQTDFNEAKAIVEGRSIRLDLAAEPETPVAPSSAAPPAPLPQSGATQKAEMAGGRRWLYSSIDEFIGTTKRSLKPDGSNGDHVFNTCDRISRARDALRDMPLDYLRRKELNVTFPTFGGRSRSMA